MTIIFSAVGAVCAYLAIAGYEKFSLLTKVVSIITLVFGVIAFAIGTDLFINIGDGASSSDVKPGACIGVAVVGWVAALASVVTAFLADRNGGGFTPGNRA